MQFNIIAGLLALTSFAVAQEAGQLADGQPTAAPSAEPSLAVSQIADNQPQAPTKAAVSQIADNQPQAPTKAPSAVISQIADNQPQAPTSAPSPTPTPVYTASGAQNVLAGGAIAAAAVAMLL